MIVKFNVDDVIRDAREDDQLDKVKKRVLGWQEIEQMIAQKRKAGSDDRNETEESG